jgi:hypothetical protein
MTCPGLHCPGCTEGQSLAIVGAAVGALVVAAEVVPWVAGHIWEIGLTLAACFALSVAASMSLEAWADRRGARFAAAHGILSRADVILPEPVRAVVVEPAPERLALAAAQITLNFYGQGGEDAAARIIRTALHGTTVDAITEGNSPSSPA